MTECIDCGRPSVLERCYRCAKRNPETRGITWRQWWIRHGHTTAPAAAPETLPEKPKFGGKAK